MTLDDLPIEDQPSSLDNHGPIFILGCPRSGTTFLSSCIAAIPNIREFVGVLAPPRLMHLIGTVESEDTRDALLSSVRDIFWQSFWRRYYFRHEQIALLTSRTIRLRELLAKPSLEGKLFCYKEPFLCFAIEHFAAHFPNAKFLHIIRDGRDNADSMERTYGDALSDDVLSDDLLSYNKVSEIGFWNRVDGFNHPWWISQDEQTEFRAMSRYGRYVRLWEEMTRRTRAVGKTLSPERYFEIRYESFVAHPLERGHDLREFLGQPDSPRFQRRLKKAFSSSSGIAQRNQSPERMNEAERVAGKLLEELGYLRP